jgi:hypothetical protein
MNERLITLRNAYLDAMESAADRYTETHAAITPEENCMAAIAATIELTAVTALELEWTNRQVRDIMARATQDIVRKLHERRRS